MKLKWSQQNKSLYFWFLLFILFIVIFLKTYKEISHEPLNSWTEDPTADCAVVLTGGAGRVREGLSLLSRKLVRKVIISGVHPEVEFSDLYSASVLLGELNEQDVILERRSSTTYGNAQQTLPLVEALSCRDLVIVTSQIHMYRAFKTFQSAFPSGFHLTKYSLVGGKNENSFWDKSLEVFKYLFYSFWAF